MELDRLFSAAKSYRYVLWERRARLAPPLTRGYPISWPLAPNVRSRVKLRRPIRHSYEFADAWLENLFVGFRHHVEVETAEIPQPEGTVAVVELRTPDRTIEVAIDYADYPEKIDRDLLGRVAVYFKMQYRRGGYGDDRIVPGGYVNASRAYYKYLPHLRALRDGQPPLFDVYGRFGSGFAQGVRGRAVDLLRGQNRFGYEGAMTTVRYSRSLIESAHSRVCVDLPGNGPFCFRLVDYLGVGACVVGPRHATELHVPLVDGRHVVHCADDLSDLVDLCREHLERPDKREALIRRSREYFDRYLHREQLAAHYLSTALDR